MWHNVYLYICARRACENSSKWIEQRDSNTRIATNIIIERTCIVEYNLVDKIQIEANNSDRAEICCVKRNKCPIRPRLTIIQCLNPLFSVCTHYFIIHFVASSINVFLLFAYVQCTLYFASSVSFMCCFFIKWNENILTLRCNTSERLSGKCACVDTFA